ncbi:hypothetical protein ACIQ4I_03270 [Rummeliibacillus sp. NPDC094406]|uniref:hypothetical protein n=1 Tax=Rummeliibacillus sp. NPDC094406 TaxID=3364511 RepID=UPI0037F54437
MLKEEFNKEKPLKNRLDEYEVKIPKELSQFKLNRWQRFIGYLASPTQDPLEEINSSLTGFKVLRISPIVVAICITIYQLFLLY